MTDHDDLDIGVEFAPEAVSEQVETSSLELGLEEYSPDLMIKAGEIARFNPYTVCLAIVMRSAPSLRNYLRMPMSDWPVEVCIKFSTIIGSLGSSKITKEVMGELVDSHLTELDTVPLDVLKARLITPKVVFLNMYTDGTLVEYVVKGAGVTITMIKEDPYGDPLEADKALIRVPGFPDGLVVGIGGSSHGRVLEGGDKFVEWSNRVNHTSFGYYQTDEDARRLAMVLMMRYNVKISKDTIEFPEHAKPQPSALRDWFHAKNELDSYAVPFYKLVQKFFSKISNRPLMAYASREAKFYYLEYVISKGLSSLSTSSRKNVDKFLGLLDKEYERMIKKVKTQCPKLFPNDGAFDPKIVVDLNNKEVAIPSGDRISTWGMLLKYVADSRKHIRNNTDMCRKSDTLGIQSVASSASSVPGKIIGAIQTLRSISGVESFPSVDAFGTHSCNWWHRTVQDSLPADGKLVFYDIKKEFSPPLGGEFDVVNIEHLPESFGKGKYLFDDTFNASDKAAADDITAVNVDEKVKSVVRAGYEGGFMKFYLGAGSDGSCDIQQLPNCVKMVREAYPRVSFAPGGSPHSPEYFIVFSKDADGKPWMPNKFPEKGHYVPGGQEAPEKEDYKARGRAHARGWLVAKGYEMLRANTLLNIQVLSCTYADFQLDVRLNYPAPTILFLSGHRRGGSEVPEALLAPVVPKEEDGGLDF